MAIMKYKTDTTKMGRHDPLDPTKQNDFSTKTYNQNEK